LLLDCLAQLSLFSQVAELQEQVTTQSQEQAILQRSLQDKAAEVEVERLSAKV
jgi:coiled-coil alpha-helical rod protein 1